MSSRLPPRAAWWRAENLVWWDTRSGVSGSGPRPQILVFHSRPILGAVRDELLATAPPAPPPASPATGAEQPGCSMKGLSVCADRPVCLASLTAGPGEGAVGAGARGLLPSREKGGPSRNLTQGGLSERHQGPLPSLRDSSTGRRAGRALSSRQTRFKGQV